MKMVVMCGVSPLWILFESVIPFLEKIKNTVINKTLSYKDYTLHVLLGGDTTFLHTVCCLQSCPPTNFCIPPKINYVPSGRCSSKICKF
jgi:hypothetical protein